MLTCFNFRGTVAGVRVHESSFNGRVSTKYFLGVLSSVRNQYGIDEQKIQEFRIPNDNDAVQCMNYYNSLKGKLVEVSFEHRSGALDDGRTWAFMVVTGVSEVKPEK
ncbi:hypothetical protein EA560_18295 [Salmonella enterica]|nr:hypothetical protein [Salmonella enterica subsp. enterica serovar Pomona]